MASGFTPDVAEFTIGRAKGATRWLIRATKSYDRNAAASFNA